MNREVIFSIAKSQGDKVRAPVVIGDQPLNRVVRKVSLKEIGVIRNKSYGDLQRGSKQVKKSKSLGRNQLECKEEER